jgi:hypothetical protein
MRDAESSSSETLNLDSVKAYYVQFCSRHWGWWSTERSRSSSKHLQIQGWHSQVKRHEQDEVCSLIFQTRVPNSPVTAYSLCSQSTRSAKAWNHRLTHLRQRMPIREQEEVPLGHTFLA